jgi:hypothetical protein
MQQLARVIGNRLADESEELDSAERTRLEAARGGITRRVDAMILPWRAMLRDLEKGTAEGFVDWFSVERGGQREYDVGLHRHWIDPTKPFADVVLSPAHGVVVTSATLRDDADGEGVDQDGWRNAELRTGFNHLVLPAKRSSHKSPFDYGAQYQGAGGARRQAHRRPAGRRPPTARCSRPRAAARSACSPPSAGCGTSTAGSPRRSPSRARLYAQHVDASTPARWSTSSAPRRMPACWAPTRCATASTCRAMRCG